MMYLIMRQLFLQNFSQVISTCTLLINLKLCVQIFKIKFMSCFEQASELRCST